MRKLWVLVALLGGVYLMVYAVTSSTDDEPEANSSGTSTVATSATPKPTATPEALDVLRQKAAGDARGRVDSASTLDVTSVRPTHFSAPDLRQETKKETPGAVPGYRLVVTSKIEDKQRARLTYHAAAPDTIVYIDTEILK